MKYLPIICLGLVVSTTSAWAKETTYIGSVETIRGAHPPTDAQGTVFLDVNRNSRLDSGEPGIADVMVSNGREVMTTNSRGEFRLPAYGDMNLFITKPAGYTTPVSDEMVPQFYYIHKEAGSPSLRFGGIPPTGPLPQRINFPLIVDDVGDRFSCLVFGDAQAYTHMELGYVRETAGRLLAARDNSDTECLMFAGDILGDDLSLYPRFKRIVSVGGVPQYFVGGNHDLDLDADSDQDSFDTFRREWGPEYYSFDIGEVHFVGLDNVRYPCNGVDPHPFCSPDRRHTYNGVISQRQLDWLREDLTHVPDDKLIVLIAHIPFVSFTDNTSAKHQTDNLHELYHIVDGRKVLGLVGHTHTTEQILPGEYFEGWIEQTGTGAAQFHQIITGGISGSWWAGDINDQGVPRSIQRLGSPRGYYQIDFAGSQYTDTYKTFHTDENTQLHAGLNTPRFRTWAQKLLDHADQHRGQWDVEPAVTVNDLGDTRMLTAKDLTDGSWVAVNVWNGSRDSRVTVKINGIVIPATRTQMGSGEAKLKGVKYADPVALAMQSTVGRIAFRSTEGDDETAGLTIWGEVPWVGEHPGPFYAWMLSDHSSHLWRADLPVDLPVGVHAMTVSTTDRYGRLFSNVMTIEVVESLPISDWQDELRKE